MIILRGFNKACEIIEGEEYGLVWKFGTKKSLRGWRDGLVEKNTHCFF